MRLRWTLALAFVALSVVQIAVVVPLALRNLSSLLSVQQEARVDQLMVTVSAEAQRLQDDVRRAMDELALSQALEDVARDAARVPAPAHVTTARDATAKSKYARDCARSRERIVDLGLWLFMLHTPILYTLLHEADQSISVRIASAA